MIKPETYTTEWLDATVKEYEANSYDLAEKMAYAFTLVEQLRIKGLDFIFKGGTSLLLMIDHFHRFSKDIDILIPAKPHNLKEIFDEIVADTPFLRWEPSERKNDQFQVPKEHYKFIYQQGRPGKYPEQPVLLDIIYVESTYPETQTVQVKHSFLQTEDPFIGITAPTLDSITGDKLTAFAPGTIGIPPGKGKAVEIAKQLFDLDLLSGKVQSSETVAKSFEQTAAMVIKYYQKSYTYTQVYDDIIETAFVMAMMGKDNPALFNEIKGGVAALSQYLSKKTSFGYNIALTAAAKVAYMVACIRNGKPLQKLDWKTVNLEELKAVRIKHDTYSILNKMLKAGYPEAWFYWLQTVNIMND
ncbi:MAG TPA: nucleotidyl transferase AbiEii/AbiGii toxin family protein [Chitinophagaceae bacterium]|jgi:hypothetical protein|nr:nucleotidyl transferase AbiEii/AbiGii toxin family protein [Chitinophagaceae bacterium]